jgi:SAM-dependent methyltransferase
MSDVWSARAAAYRESEAHREGRDLDLIVEWATGARTALDVATGGGHVARRLREAGVNVVTTDAAPGMEPDVVCRSEELPFADGSFDAVVCRVAAHHFDDVERAVAEMARVSGSLVLISDNLHGGEELERAEQLRDPSHVRNYGEAEWRRFLEAAGARIETAERVRHPVALEPWLDRAGCSGEDAERVRELVADRLGDGKVVLDRIVIKAVKA